MRVDDVASNNTGATAEAWCLRIHAETSPSRGEQGENLVPPYTRGSVFRSVKHYQETRVPNACRRCGEHYHGGAGRKPGTCLHTCIKRLALSRGAQGQSLVPP